MNSLSKLQSTPDPLSIAGRARCLVAKHIVDSFDGKPQPTMLRNIARFAAICVGGLVTIRDVHSHEVPLVPNDAQTIVLASMMDQAEREQPVRIVVLKSRKHGISTLIQAFFADVCSENGNQIAKTLAHETDATHEIFEIAKRASKRHNSVDVQARRILWPNGSWYACYTAAGQAVGAGGTPSLLHRSEGPKWKINKVETEYNSSISVPDVLETCIVDEFTALGRELFFQRFEDAHDPEHSWCPIFLPWYIDSRCTTESEAIEPDDYEDQLCESALKHYGWKIADAQLAWRRLKIRDLGDEAIFRQEYPSTPQEAVQATAGLIFAFARECIVDDVPFIMGQIPESEKVGGIDFGYHHPTVIWSGVHRNGVLWLTDFHRASERLADEHREGIRPQTTYWCDPAEAQERANFIKASSGMYCRFAPAPRVRNAGEDIATAEMRKLVKWMRDGKLKILRSIASQLVLECDNLAWDEKTGKPDDKTCPPGVGHYDSIFALKYLVMGLETRGDGTIGDAKKSNNVNRRKELASW